MRAVIMTGIISLICWWAALYAFHRDRSRYRNCYLLFLALLSTIPLLVSMAGPYARTAVVVIANVILIGLLIVPFFLIYNGIVMMIREGKRLPQLLSLALGVVILFGEAVTFFLIIGPYLTDSFSTDPGFYHSALFAVGAVFSVTVIYGAMAFLVFMIYTLFLQVIPRKNDFDYVIIHGAGLLEGQKVSKLLRDRLDKAVEVYRKDPTPPKLIPSGGQGADERIPEAEAMKRYLLEQGIPGSDILPESKSTTTLENLQFSKRILDGREGRKYTALVTSNYHVYRALRYCRKIGLECTGIGSHVAFYYWPSAMIREFIAIHAEKKHAVLFIAGWLLCVAVILTAFLR